MVATHIWYEYDRDGSNVTGFRVKLNAVPGKDPVGTYFMACGFTGGYFGMQINSETERRILFSVWDSVSGPCEVVEEGEDVIVQRFGGEGEGYQSIFKHQWKAGEDQDFMVTANIEQHSTVFSGYYLLNGSWKVISKLRKPDETKGLHGLYSFLENFLWGKLEKECRYGAQFILREGSDKWEELKQCRCTNTGNPPPTTDWYGFGIEGSNFTMRIDGCDKGVIIPVGRRLDRPCCQLNPDPQ